ncbi:hypothetical protein JB92DRAFT_2904739, partial [Gautieria morchelliformis]
MRMPRFLQPFRRRDRGVQPEYIEDPLASSYSDPYDYNQSSLPRSGSRWRNMLTKRDRPRDAVYVDEASEEYLAPSDVGRAPMANDYRHRPSSRRAREVDRYSDSSITDSNSLPVRYPRQGSETQFLRDPPPQAFDHEPAPYVHRMPSHESFHPESVPHPLDQDPSDVPPFVAPPGEVYMDGPIALQDHDPENVSQYTQDPPVIHGEHRRFRPRRGEPVTVGGVRIEVDGTGRDGRHRGRRSRSRSVDSYSSGSSRSYTSSSSFEEQQPIIISADPHTEIEVHNYYHY